MEAVKVREKKSIKPIKLSTIVKSYSVFFLILALWTLIPVIAPNPLSMSLYSKGHFLANSTFSILCVIASLGIFYKNRLCGYFLGNLILLLALSYHANRLVVEPSLNPLLIFSFLNLGAILIIFGKMLAPEFQKVISS